MNEVLLKKIKYLLSFKFNTEGNEKFLPLLEKLFYEFFISLESCYNEGEKTAYYNLLLNKFNSNIKSIIAPSDIFYYHSLGFLELNTNLKNLLQCYVALDISITPSLKEEVLKKKLFLPISNSAESGKRA